MKTDLLAFSESPAQQALVNLARLTWNLNTSVESVQRLQKNPPKLIVIDDESLFVDGLSLVKQFQNFEDSPIPCLFIRRAAESIDLNILTQIGIRCLLHPRDFSGLFQQIQKELTLPETKLSMTVSEVIARHEESFEALDPVLHSGIKSSVLEQCISFLIFSKPPHERQHAFQAFVENSSSPECRDITIKLWSKTQSLDFSEITQLLGYPNQSLDVTLGLLSQLRKFQLGPERLSQLESIFKQSQKIIQADLLDLILGNLRKLSHVSRTSVYEELQGGRHTTQTTWSKIQSLIANESARKTQQKNKTTVDVLFNSSLSAKDRIGILGDIGDDLAKEELQAALVRLLCDKDKSVALNALTILLSESHWTVKLAERVTLDQQIPTDFRQATLLSTIQRAPGRELRKLVDTLISDTSFQNEAILLKALQLTGDKQHEFLEIICTSENYPTKWRCWSLRYLSSQNSSKVKQICEILHNQSERNLRGLAWRIYLSSAETLQQLNYERFSSQIPIEHLQDALDGLATQAAWATHILLPLAQDNKQSIQVRQRSLSLLQSSATPFLRANQINELRERLKALKKVSEPHHKPPPLPRKDDESFAKTQEAEPVSSDLQNYIPGADFTKPAPARLPSEAIQPVSEHSDAFKISAESSDLFEDIEATKTQEEDAHRTDTSSTDYNRLLHEALSSQDHLLEKLGDLVKQTECPDEIRCKALEAALAIAPQSEDTRQIIEVAIQSGKTELQHQALAPDIHQSGWSLETLRNAVYDLGNDISVRIRALRSLQSSSLTKEQFTAACEQLFYDYDGEIRRSALELVFPSIRFAHSSDVENQLINLSEEHPSSRARCSAALALGAFGKHKAYEYLKREKGKLFKSSDFRKAANQSITLLQQRLGINSDD
ncbi:MAG: HEAT repeat domain-containing protein [Myxococcota bacterium]|nr:HEAT repeat domain-containing protein [Myxococcota bacterium]